VVGDDLVAKAAKVRKSDERLSHFEAMRQAARRAA
jgi:hypothetical protein